jgi:hypothetical protein
VTCFHHDRFGGNFQRCANKVVLKKRVCHGCIIVKRIEVANAEPTSKPH